VIFKDETNKEKNLEEEAVHGGRKGRKNRMQFRTSYLNTISTTGIWPRPRLHLAWCPPASDTGGLSANTLPGSASLEIDNNNKLRFSALI
jgi:hypothetical protein